MKADIRDLRYRMKDVLAALDRGEPVTILYRGRAKARLVPVESAATDPAFGMWKSRKDLANVAGYVRKIRQPRSHNL